MENLIMLMSKEAFRNYWNVTEEPRANKVEPHLSKGGQFEHQ